MTGRPITTDDLKTVMMVFAFIIVLFSGAIITLDGLNGSNYIDPQRAKILFGCLMILISARIGWKINP